MAQTDVTDVELVGDRGARLERIFQCTPEVLWDTMTNAALIPQWWGPEHHAPTVVEMDVRPGGRWRFELHAHDNIFGFGGQYLAVERPTLLRQTFVFDPFPDHGSTEEATLTALPDGTTLFQVIIEHPTAEGRDQQLASGMVEGMQETHRRLAALVAQQ